MRSITTVLNADELGFILASMAKFFVTANVTAEEAEVAEKLVEKLQTKWEASAK